MSISAAEFNVDSTQVIVRGSVYLAKDAPAGKCTAGPNCAFAVGFGCDLTSRAEWNPRCKNREDGRHIVWVSRVAALRTTR